MTDRYSTPGGGTVEVRHGLLRDAVTCTGCGLFEKAAIDADRYAAEHAANCRRIPDSTVTPAPGAPANATSTRRT